MVVRTSALAQSAFIYDLGNSFDNDRMLLFELSKHGPVLFNPKIAVVVRHHDNRDTSLFSREGRCRRMAQTSEWMVNSGLKSWRLVASAFAKRLADCPDDKKKMELICVATIRSWCLPEMARHLDRTRDKEFFSLYDYARTKFGASSAQEDSR